MKLGTSFGINADAADPVNPMTKFVEGEEDEERPVKRESEPNVLDYRNSSVLAFVLLIYVSGFHLSRCQRLTAM